ncbi:hypothetical protein KVV02_001097 [Mortierella alpina]|uniref:PH domain-containing protein n=1 Tax=Mortierella alpina TaxID=64518 RepID=A0A9P8CZ27_MORAP|nr:hypothetical protein KVV02_001097 [Mortierella alpina]
MRFTLSKRSQTAQKEAGSGHESGSAPTVVYSGHLLKLGSNNRWQSRLFTFDGSVLKCIGKRSRRPTIVTYDPHVSSPFASSSERLQQLEPNTKWSIDLSLVVDISLSPAAKSGRYFMPISASKQLSLQTSDGETRLLRASKDADLERWYFVLVKIWEQQVQQVQQVGTTESSDTRHLAAHQQSKQLFEKYLQKQHDHKQEHSPSQEQTQQPPLAAQTHPHHLQPLPREGVARYRLPQPSRLSGVLPQGVDHPPQEHGNKDGNPMRLSASFLEPQTTVVARERRQPERQASWSHQLQIAGPIITGVRNNRELIRSSSVGMVNDRFGYPAGGSMEPEKVAIIDNWRRSLLSPLGPDEEATTDAKDCQGSDFARHVSPLDRGAEKRRDEGVSDASPLQRDPRDIDSALKHQSLGIDYVGHNISYADLRPISQSTPPMQDDIHQARKRSSCLLLGEEQFALQYGLQGATVQMTADSSIEREEDELPLGLLQSNRHSRWLNTQLSSEDGASGIQQDPTVFPTDTQHRLLPSGPITPEQAPPKCLQLSPPSELLSARCTSSESASANEDKKVFAPATVSVSTVPSAGPPFTVQVPLRQLRPCPSIPTSSMASGPTDPVKRLMTVDTSPYTNIALSNPNHPTPPPRPCRPVGVTLSPLITPDEPSPSMSLPVVGTHHSPLAPQSETLCKADRHQRQPSLSRSISAMSSKLASLREEVNAANAKADEAEAKVKELQEDQTKKDHEITSLKNKLTLVEADLEKAENTIAEAKLNLDEGETTKTVGEGLARKVSLLETELDSAETNLRETTEKLRQMDIKAEHFERKVQQLEGQRDAYETKIAELTEKYDGIKKELDETLKSLEDM